MTRDQIRATIEGLERIARGECHSGNRREIAHDALTLLREMSGVNVVALQTSQEVWQTFEALDSERKAANP